MDWDSYVPWGWLTTHGAADKHLGELTHTPWAAGSALQTAREALASAKRLSRCACRAWILLWVMPLIPITNLLAKASRAEAALATLLPPPKVSIPRDGACWGATRAHGDALSPLSGFEVCQTEPHGTSGTHGEYNHGRVQSLRQRGYTARVVPFFTLRR